MFEIFCSKSSRKFRFFQSDKIRNIMPSFNRLMLLFARLYLCIQTCRLSSENFCFFIISDYPLTLFPSFTLWHLLKSVPGDGRNIWKGRNRTRFFKFPGGWKRTLCTNSAILFWAQKSFSEPYCHKDTRPQLRLEYKWCKTSQRLMMTVTLAIASASIHHLLNQQIGHQMQGCLCNLCRCTCMARQYCQWYDGVNKTWLCVCGGLSINRCTGSYL